MTETTPAAAPANNRGVMIVLAYLWILALVPLLTEKEDKEVQWHAKHGIVLMVAEILFWIAYTILTNLIVAVTLGLGCIVAILSPVIAFAFLIVHVLAIMKGVNGQRFTLPYVSEFADKF